MKRPTNRIGLIQKISLLSISCFMLATLGYSQGVSISADENATADPSALLDVDASTLTTKKGILVPRMTLSERDAITTPANGLLVYVTTNGNQGFYYYDSPAGIWQALANSAMGDNDWIIDGDNIYFTKPSGKVGIGTSTPNQALDISGNLQLNTTDNVIRMKDKNGVYHQIEPSSDGRSGLVVRTTTDQQEVFQVQSSDGSADFAVYHDNRVFVPGKIGIGTSAPTEAVTINGDIDMLQGQNTRIHSVGEISFDWTTGGTYDSPQNHGIQSKDEAGNWTDELRINSFDNLILTLDANDNNATSRFVLQEHSTTNGPDLFTVSSPSGNTYIAGALGIGTTSPTQQLEVNGTAKVEHLVIGGATGTIGQGDGEELRWGGTTSDLVGHRQGGHGRIALAWNAEWDNINKQWKSVVGSEQHSIIGMSNTTPGGGTNSIFLGVADANTAAGDVVNWDGVTLKPGPQFGIGTTAPSSSLDVVGSAEINGQLDMKTNKITNLADPIANQDAATKNYVDAAVDAGACQPTNVQHATGGAGTNSWTVVLNLTGKSGCIFSFDVLQTKSTYWGLIDMRITVDGTVYNYNRVNNMGRLYREDNTFNQRFSEIPWEIHFNNSIKIEAQRENFSGYGGGSISVWYGLEE